MHVDKGWLNQLKYTKGSGEGGKKGSITGTINEAGPQGELFGGAQLLLATLKTAHYFVLAV